MYVEYSRNIMADQINAILKNYSQHTNGEMMRILLNMEKIGQLQDMMMYHLGWLDERLEACEFKGGKHLRSILCLLACEAIAGDYRQALPAAAAIEFVHNFSLIHDDIEDGDERRRHRSTVWKLWGIPQAINTGDAMHVISHIAITGLKARPESKIEIMRVFNDTLMHLCEGQYLDMDFQTRQDVTIEEYMEMITYKTGALIGAATTIGAIAGGGNRETVLHFQSFGHKIGVAFQIKDDILDIWGDLGKTGKSSRNDIRNKKKTLPVLFALQHPPDRNELKHLYAKEKFTEMDIERIFELLTKAKAYDYTSRIAKQYKDEAMSELEGLCPGSRAMNDLQAIGHFLVDRDY
jgi:geranylgeranyl diphosphate synthase type I